MLLSFLNPWFLAGLIGLPLLWLWLKKQPPQPKILFFPAMRLLDKAPAQPPWQMPWWWRLLRVLMVALVILALAEPEWGQPPQLPHSDQAASILVDNSLLSAPHWASLQAKLAQLTKAMQDANQPYTIYALAPNGQGRLLAGQDIPLKPQPWLTRWDQLPDAAMESSAIYLLSSGYSPIKQDQPLYLHVIDKDYAPLLVTDVLVQGNTVAVDVACPFGLPATDLVLYDAEGQALGQQPATCGAVTLDLPPGMARQVRQVTTAPYNGLASVHVLPDLALPTTGLLSRKTTTPSLLEEERYLQALLDDSLPLHIGGLDVLLEKQLGALILPDHYGATAAELAQLQTFVADGGLLLRLAGDNMAEKPDGLTPVPIRYGVRRFDSQLIGRQQPFNLIMPPGSPLIQLATEALAIKATVAAQPDASASVWARLDDQSPFITAKTMGQGQIVLIHGKFTPTWGNLGYRAETRDLLHYILAQAGSKGQGSKQQGAAAVQAMQINQMLNAMGQLTVPAPAAFSADLAKAPLTPTQPAGYYNQGAAVLNAAPHMPPLYKAKAAFSQATPWPVLGTYIVLAPWLLLLAFVLFIIDTLLLRRPVWRMGAIMLMFALPLSAIAAPSVKLAYTNPQDAGGLQRLTQAVNQRTIANLAPAEQASIDNLMHYPLIYASPAPQTTNWLTTHRAALQRYLADGGMLVLDTKAGFNAARRGLVENQLSPALAAFGHSFSRMQPVPQPHILLHTYYLLPHYTGQAGQGQPRTARLHHPARAPVAPLVLLDQNLVAAWQQWPNNAAQGEQAIRSGINLVFYALTGTYKDDTVHMEEIMDRLGR